MKKNPFNLHFADVHNLKCLFQYFKYLHDAIFKMFVGVKNAFTFNNEGLQNWKC